jgi:protein DGCR14
MIEAEKKEKTKLHRAWLYEQERRIQKVSGPTGLRLGDCLTRFDFKLQEDNIALPNIEQQMLQSNTGSVDTWGYKTKNAVMYGPEGAELTFEEKLEMIKKTRVIKHENTRFKAVPFDLTASGANSSKKFGQLNAKLGVDGKELLSDETPKVNGYGFVEPMPSPVPGQLAGDESPMMTWGEIEGTPFRLDVTNSPYLLHGGTGPEFKIPDVPHREKIALDLEEKASVARRKRKLEALKCVQRSLTHSPRLSDSPNASLTDRINIMSPAAQRLLSSKLTIRPNSNKSGSSSRDSTPTHSPLVSPVSVHSSGFKSPIINNKNSTMTNLKANLKRASLDSLTDDLLKLPK